MLEDDERTSNAISRLIVNQGEMRDMMKFFKNLRLPACSEEVSDSIGLKTLNLSHNKFSSNFILEVCQILQFDLYVKTIDLSHNLVKSKDFTDELIDAPSQNFKLVALKLDHNP